MREIIEDGVAAGDVVKPLGWVALSSLLYLIVEPVVLVERVTRIQPFLVELHEH